MMATQPASSQKATNKAKVSFVKDMASDLDKVAAKLRDPVNIDLILDEDKEIRRYQKLMKWIGLQTIIIAILSGVLLLGAPFFMPIYQYYARNTKQEVMQLVPLTAPNMTNRAILSWATTSITEIMTMGFGDYKTKLPEQRFRFTPGGWDAFAMTFDKLKVGEKFQQNQLVLTTVPSTTPVIVQQGPNERHVYQWRVQMPVIMTYATNNNLTSHERAVVDLTIIRVNPNQNPAGIGIDSWRLEK
jgi:intracellular multiplication protein IcmL